MHLHSYVKGATATKREHDLHVQCEKKDEYKGKKR